MFNNRANYAVAPSTSCDRYVQQTVTERLMRRKKDLECELERINSALTALTDNPQIQGVIDTLSKLSI